MISHPSLAYVNCTLSGVFGCYMTLNCTTLYLTLDKSVCQIKCNAWDLTLLTVLVMTLRKIVLLLGSMQINIIAGRKKTRLKEVGENLGKTSEITRKVK